ncbi:MAG: polysaccharide (de)acetylase [Desulfamplus sp.]|nr:polysaccharide (de)acetylase [Desulfamplus sp.]
MAYGKISSIKNAYLAALSRANGYLKGWRTNHKIVVIESDDWGSIRTSSPYAFNYLLKKGYQLEKSCYSYDSLETNEDIEELYKVLFSVRDCRNRPACFTANIVLANPDFTKIESNGFDYYEYSPIDKTLQQFQNRNRVIELWLQGFANKCFIPQFHAREHVAWWNWLKALKGLSTEALETFKLGMCGVPLAVSKENQSFFTPIYINKDKLKSNGVDLQKVIKEGLQLFQDILGYKSLSTVAPNVSWTDDTEKLWALSGIRFIQGGFIQESDDIAGFSKRLHYTGESNIYNSIYLTRNCSFEPSKTKNVTWVNCIRAIDLLFKLSQPAIICSHRVNYIGSINPKNRDRSLDQLKNLLMMIVKKWPDVIFLSSPELGMLIEKDLKSRRYSL